MKQKFLLVMIIPALSLCLFSNCGKCDGEDPKISIHNSDTRQAKIMFSKNGENKYTIDNIGPGSTTSTFSYPMTGIVSVTLFSDNYVSANIELSKCSTYKITVNGSSISFIESEN